MRIEAGMGQGSKAWCGGTFTPNPSAVDRKSTRLNSSHLGISYAVFCLKKKNKTRPPAGGPRWGTLSTPQRARGGGQGAVGVGRSVGRAHGVERVVQRLVFFFFKSAGPPEPPPFSLPAPFRI